MRSLRQFIVCFTVRVGCVLMAAVLAPAGCSREGADTCGFEPGRARARGIVRFIENFTGHVRGIACCSSKAALSP